jgi:hypothetical protein
MVSAQIATSIGINDRRWFVDMIKIPKSIQKCIGLKSKIGSFS